MISNYILSCLLGILAYLVANTVARSAIVGGKVAGTDQVPYFVSVRIDNEDTCGGGIIGNQFIITAAHCIINDHDGELEHHHVSILAGTNDRKNTKRPATIVQVTKIFVPKAYKPPATSTFTDIAILKLAHPLEFSKHIQKVELPVRKDETYFGKVATFAGFGWDWVKIIGQELDGGNNSTQLRYADADVLTPTQCGKDYGVRKTPDVVLCARVKHHGAAVHGACVGDSGGPLVHDGTVIGVLNHGPDDCSEKIKSGIYTRVSHYLNFIHNAIKDHHADNIRVFDLGICNSSKSSSCTTL